MLAVLSFTLDAGFIPRSWCGVNSGDSGDPFLGADVPRSGRLPPQGAKAQALRRGAPRGGLDGQSEGADGWAQGEGFGLAVGGGGGWTIHTIGQDARKPWTDVQRTLGVEAALRFAPYGPRKFRGKRG